MTLKNSLLICRLIFTTLLVCSLLGAFTIGKSVQIDTNLADVSPKTNNPVITDKAINALSRSIEKRIILLISGDNEDAVYDAQGEIEAHLSLIKSITLQLDPDELSEHLIENLKPYRFSLLTQSQRSILINKSAQQIATASENSLYNLSSPARIYNFNDDPLGWHSETLINLLSDGLIIDEQAESETSYAVLSASINSSALNLNTQTTLSKQLDSAIDQIKLNHSVNVDRSGIFFFASHAAKSSKQDISFISAFSTIGVVLLLLLVFRSLRALLLPVISIALGVGFAFITTHLLYGSVHILTIVFGASMIGIVVDYSLHYFYHHAHSHEQAQTNSLYKALTFSLMTSIIGYTALSFSSLAALQKVATFSCLGLFMAWLSVICLGQISLKKPLTIYRTVFSFLVEKAIKIIDRTPKVFWRSTCFIIILLAGFIFIQYSPFTDNPKVFFTAPEHLLLSEQKVASVANDYEPGRYIIISGESDALVYKRHAFLMSLIERSNNLNKSQFTSLLNWVPNRQSQHTDYLLQEKLYLNTPNSVSSANILLQSLGQTDAKDLSNNYIEAKNRILTPDKVVQTLGQTLPPLWFKNKDAVVNFILIKKGANADSLNSLLHNIEGIEYINSLERTESALRDQRKSATQLLFLAYFLVGLLILIFYRSLSSLSLLIVPACASSMVLIASVFFNFDLNLFHVMALFLVLGFGMDYTIFSKEMFEQQNVTLEAILLSACTSLLSFGLLSLSSIPVVASFGITLLIGNLFNLLGAFVYARLQTLST